VAQPDPIVKSRQLQKESQEIRLNALRVQIDAANALCSTAEVEARWESPETAEKSLQKIESAIARLFRHIENCTLVAVLMNDELRGRLAGIETRLQTIRNSLQTPKSKVKRAPA
jgi:hypothetical protein